MCRPPNLVDIYYLYLQRLCQTLMCMLIACAFQGVVASGMTLFLQCWANHRGGPLLIAAYVPVQTIFSVTLSYLFLDDIVYLGRYVGSSYYGS